jgi:hypothetical protein
MTSCTAQFPFTQRSTAVVLALAVLAFQGGGQAKPKTSGTQQKAAEVLARYVQLRLRDADWKEYAKFITWSDEPSWDCKWVASKDKLGAPVKKGKAFLIPVVYSRLGLFCYDFDFKSEPKLVTIKYELVKGPSGWKVNAPIPDYPDISSDALIMSLNATAEDTNETPERRAEAEKTVREIREALKSGTTFLSRPKND